LERNRKGFFVESVNLKKTDIHPTAVVHPWARIGVGVKIGPYSVIGPDVTLGDGCEVGPNALVEGATTIGRNNRIFHGASVGTEPQDLKYEGGRTRLVIGDNNVIREFVTINTATHDAEETSIGSNCLLMAYAHVAHNCIIGDHVILANAVNLAGHVVVDDYAIIGGVTPVHQFVRIGKHAFVGGGSRIEKDVPPFLKLAGNPPSVYGINSVGLARRGYSEERRAEIKGLYKLIYRRGLNTSQVIEKLESDEFSGPDVEEMLTFLKTCERGIQK
jgi:UDP-N-acetylglucosamine acyltransferase